MTVLKVAFLIDAIVSGLMAGAILTGKDAVVSMIFGEKSSASEDIRILIGVIWLAVAICLALGMIFPVAMSAILIMQLFYKSIYLMTYANSKLISNSSTQPARGVAGLFFAYVVVYPWLIPWSRVFIIE